MKNVLKIILAIMMITMLFVIFSCDSASNSGEGGDAKPDNDGSGDIPADAGADNAANSEPEYAFPHDVIDLKGETFKILIDYQWTENSLDIEDYDIEEMNGEVLNDAIYNRNLKIEETYSLKLEGVKSADRGIESFVNKIIKAGMDEYDAIAPRLMNAATFAAKGYGINMYETALTLDAPWWDQNILKDTSIGGAAYFISGDIFIKHYDGIALLMFNKKMLTELGLETPYNFVNNNQWTMDKFNELVKGVYFDIDQDGKHNRYDRYGFVTQLDYLTSFINASGEKLVSKDADDLPVFTGNGEKISAILDKMNEVYLDETYCMHRNAYDKEGGGGQAVQFWVFPEGRGLFYWAFPRYMDLGLRDMEDDFGIVPIPKWDSSQSRYYATVNNWHSYTYMLPVTVGDVERNSIILDAMAYEGRKLIKPAYYEVCLQRKYTRDEESSEMLDIIFSSTVYDICTVYAIGGYTDALGDGLRDNKINVASAYDKNQGKINKDIAKLIDNFENAKY